MLFISAMPSMGKQLQCLMVSRTFARKRPILKMFNDTNNTASAVEDVTTTELTYLSPGDQESSIVSVKNSQKRYPINFEILKSQAILIKDILKVSDYKLDVLFCTDNRIKKENEESRGKAKVTDVISYQVNDFVAPEVFKRSRKLRVRQQNAEKNLGSMLIAPAYVKKRITRDRLEYENGQLDVSEDAGVSKHMATCFSLEERLPLLMIHGMLHMLGYDHETDPDWERMTKREEEVVQEYKKRWSEKLLLDNTLN